jgi:diaminopimelate epimerase
VRSDSLNNRDSEERAPAGDLTACGTGACATAAAAMSEQPMAERVTVRVRGGDLFVRPGPGGFELAGPAEYVFDGSTP